MRNLMCVTVLLFFLFSCRTYRCLSGSQMCSDTVSSMQIQMTDSVKDLFRESESASMEWDIVWERTLYNSDTFFCTPVREKQTLVMSSRAASQRDAVTDKMATGYVVWNQSDSSRVKVNRYEDVERKGVSFPENIFWILIVLLIVGVCVRILKY